jgi:hypothetical protein
VPIANKSNVWSEDTVKKQHFTYLYSPVRERSLTKRNILAIRRGSGLCPFDPERVLADMPRSPTKPRISNVDELRVESRPGYEALPTPTMLVLGDALTSLLVRIKQVPDDEASSQKKWPSN